MPMRMTKPAIARFALASALIGVALVVPHVSASGPRPSITVLSNRADLISGGDALVSVAWPSATITKGRRVTLNGHDITSEFRFRPNGKYEALVSKLRLGRNVLTATAAGGDHASTVIVNHPAGGPLIGGPQRQPWPCQATAVDKQCDQKPTYAYYYMPRVLGAPVNSLAGQPGASAVSFASAAAFQPYDPASTSPAVVATTTTDQGRTVPYIVRVETGYVDRDSYQIAVLYDPSRPWAPWAPQPQFNHKLIIVGGANCGHVYGAASAPGSPLLGELGRGFATLVTSSSNAGNICGHLTQAESLIMAKERLIEEYGELRYTIGIGGSGGSIMLQQVTNAYPGLVQGLVVLQSFPDAWTLMLTGWQTNQLVSYFEDPSRWATGVVWNPATMAAVEGYMQQAQGQVAAGYGNSFFAPSSQCTGVPASLDYEPTTNPRGLRCTESDYHLAVLGPRPRSAWGAVEAKLSRGFGDSPSDNEGVMYGLQTLREGLITPAQFVDLNVKAGGRDIDYNPTVARTRADSTALARAYSTGAVNRGNNLGAVPIIDMRAASPTVIHQTYYSLAMRSRLQARQGMEPANYVSWFYSVPEIGEIPFQSDGIAAVDRWLTAVERDPRHLALAVKVASDRPTNVTDQCFIGLQGTDLSETPAGDLCRSQLWQARYGDPLTVAGAPIARDTLKCTLKPLLRSDLFPVVFSSVQWALLRKTFPTGVCDWSKPGPLERNVLPWLTYQDDQHGAQIVPGGHPLGPASPGSGTGWASPAFRGWLSGR